LTKVAISSSESCGFECQLAQGKMGSEAFCYKEVGNLIKNKTFSTYIIRVSISFEVSVHSQI